MPLLCCMNTAVVRALIAWEHNTACCVCSISLIRRVEHGAHLDGKEDIYSADDIVVLCEHGPGAIDHGVRRRALLAKVDHSVRLEGLKRLGQELKVADVSNLQVNVLSADLAPPAWSRCNGVSECKRQPGFYVYSVCCCFTTKLHPRMQHSVCHGIWVSGGFGILQTTWQSPNATSSYSDSRVTSSHAGGRMQWASRCPSLAAGQRCACRDCPRCSLHILALTGGALWPTHSIRLLLRASADCSDGMRAVCPWIMAWLMQG